MAKREHQDSDLKADLKSYLASRLVDDIADYVARGRRHSSSPDGALFAAWKDAMRAFAAQPFDEKLRAGHYDLYCEIELRGLKAPEEDEDIVDAVAMLRSKVAEVGERLLQNPDAAGRFGAGIFEDVEEYKSKRHRNAN
jgi:hypothetical protein